MKNKKAYGHLMRAREILNFGTPGLLDLPEHVNSVWEEYLTREELGRLSMAKKGASTIYDKKHNELQIQRLNDKWKNGTDIDQESVLSAIWFFPSVFGYLPIKNEQGTSVAPNKELVCLVIKRLVENPDLLPYDIPYDRAYRRFRAVAGAHLALLPDIRKLFYEKKQPGIAIKHLNGQIPRQAIIDADLYFNKIYEIQTDERTKLSDEMKAMFPCCIYDVFLPEALDEIKLGNEIGHIRATINRCQRIYGIYLGKIWHLTVKTHKESYAIIRISYPRIPDVDFAEDLSVDAIKRTIEGFFFPSFQRKMMDKSKIEFVLASPNAKSGETFLHKLNSLFSHKPIVASEFKTIVHDEQMCMFENLKRKREVTSLQES